MPSQRAQWASKAKEGGRAAAEPGCTQASKEGRTPPSPPPATPDRLPAHLVPIGGPAVLPKAQQAALVRHQAPGVAEAGGAGAVGHKAHRVALPGPQGRRRMPHIEVAWRHKMQERRRSARGWRVQHATSTAASEDKPACICSASGMQRPTQPRPPPRSVKTRPPLLRAPGRELSLPSRYHRPSHSTRLASMRGRGSSTRSSRQASGNWVAT